MKFKLLIFFIKIEQKLRKIFKNDNESFIANIFYKILLKKIKFNGTTIFISSNKCDEINNELTNLYKKLNYKVISNNNEKYNFKDIVTKIITSSKLNTKIDADYLILNVNISNIKLLLKYLNPDYFIINDTKLSLSAFKRKKFLNLFSKTHNKNITFIINSNNIDFSDFYKFYSKKCIYFGITNINNVIGKISCPNCNKKIKYSVINNKNLGNFICDKCLSSNTENDYIASNINFDLNYFYINKLKINLINNTYDEIYKNLISFILLKTIKAYDIDILNLLSKRNNNLEIEKSFINNKEMIVYKNNNNDVILYNNIIEHITNCPGYKTIIIGLTTSKLNFTLEDINWLYDINFEHLVNEEINKIICTGFLASELAVRLSYSLINSEKIIIIKDITKIYELLNNKSINKVYTLLYNDLLLYLKKDNILCLN